MVTAWNMMHKVKSLYDDGNGLDKKTIARHLNISINTLYKYRSIILTTNKDFTA